MKRALLIALAAALAGCATDGFNVQAVVTMTYNTSATTTAVLTPGAVPPLPAASAAK